MISRLTASAACFAILSAATITFAAGTATHHDPAAATTAASAPAVVQLPRVEVVGRRVPR